MNLRSKAWSPYLAGIVVGILQIPALLIISAPLGVSSSYVSVSGYLAGLFDPDVSTMDYFGKYMASIKYLWQASMVLAVALGAYLSMKLSGARRKSFSPAWTRACGIGSLWPRMLMGFIGGFIMLFGARWADGCTSGHGLSGVGQLAVSSVMVTISFFVAGIFVSMFYKKL
ncbi:MAG: lipocalin [Desulfobulbaceae bacterium BRH_c16a]|nr:MAG: lipocalin [Desulfobulbaceae bacterium BRH_c16a]